MRVAIVALLALAAQTLCAQPSSERQVSFSLEEANRILDSLQSRGDWQRMYAIQTARLHNRESSLTHYEWLDSLSKTQLVMCDSVLRKQYTKLNELSSENATLQRKVSNRGRNWFLVPLGILIGLIIQ